MNRDPGSTINQLVLKPAWVKTIYAQTFKLMPRTASSDWSATHSLIMVWSGLFSQQFPCSLANAGLWELFFPRTWNCTWVFIQTVGSCDLDHWIILSSLVIQKLILFRPRKKFWCLVTLFEASVDTLGSTGPVGPRNPWCGSDFFSEGCVLEWGGERLVECPKAYFEI